MTAYKPKILSRGPQSYFTPSLAGRILKLKQSHCDGKLKLALKFKHNSKDTPQGETRESPVSL